MISVFKCLFHFYLVILILASCQTSHLRSIASESAPIPSEISQNNLYEQISSEWQKPTIEFEKKDLISSDRVKAKLDENMKSIITEAKFFTKYSTKASQYYYKYIVDDRSLNNTRGHRSSYKSMLIKAGLLYCRAEVYISGVEFKDYGLLNCYSKKTQPLEFSAEFPK